MKCPACGNMETKVIDSRVIEWGKSIRRRRSCDYCEHRFTTLEKIVVTDLVVKKKDGSKELYDRNKLRRALIVAFGKKHLSMDVVEDIHRRAHEQGGVKRLPAHDKIRPANIEGNQVTAEGPQVPQVTRLGLQVVAT